MLAHYKKRDISDKNLIMILILMINIILLTIKYKFHDYKINFNDKLNKSSLEIIFPSLLIKIFNFNYKKLLRFN